MKTVLVTGGNGFIGKWLVNSLAAEGLHVKILCRSLTENSQSSKLPENVSLVVGDMTQVETLKDALTNVDSVYHLAGHIAYDPNERARMIAINVDGTKNLLAAMKEKRVGNLLHCSSTVAVGALFHPGKPLNEESPFQLHDLNFGYYETKLAAEALVKDFAKSHHAVIVNPANVYGPGDAAKGSRSSQIKVAQGKMLFSPSGGVSVLSVHDVVQGMISALKNGRTGQRYILSGENMTAKEMFAIIAKHGKAKPPPLNLSDSFMALLGATGDLSRKLRMPIGYNSERTWSARLYHWYDNSKAKKELGFNPRSADLALKESVDWMREQGIIS